MIDMLADLYWREPHWLWALGLPLIWLGWGHWWRRHQWTRLADPQLLPWLQAHAHGGTERASTSRRITLLLAWLFLTMAMAGPRTPELPPSSTVLPVHDVILVVDRSRSMEARDGRPDRIGAVRHLLSGWLNEAGHLRWGLVMFAGHAHLIAPATTDTTFIQNSMDALLSLPLPTLGNALASALQQALDSRPSSSVAGRSVLLFSDGDMEPRERDAAMALAARWNPDIDLIVVGVGGARPLPIPDGEAGWLRFEDEDVLTLRDEVWLKALADRAGGRYLPLEDIETISDVVSTAEGRIPASKAGDVLWREWFALPLMLGVALMFMSLLRRDSAPSALGVLLLISVLSQSPEGYASEPDIEDGRLALERSDWQAAQAIYQSLDGYEARFGEGVACYRLEDWACASEAWSAAVLQAADSANRARAIFNLGNLHFRLGRYAQAEVLFEDVLGIMGEPGSVPGLSIDQVKINLSYASDLRRAVEQAIEDQRKTTRRAAFLARAEGDVLDQGLEQASLRVSTLEFARQLSGLRSVTASELRSLLARGVASIQGNTGGNELRSDTAGSPFVRGTPHGDRSDTRLSIWKRRLEMDVGSEGSQSEPKQVQGKRPW
ncbi:MAG: vWA domain-containing protein [Gammaproteobacteria bacterium]